jgi:hypothetical protein
VSKWLEILIAVPIVLVVGWLAGPAAGLLAAVAVVTPELLSWERATCCFPRA